MIGKKFNKYDRYGAYHYRAFQNLPFKDLQTYTRYLNVYILLKEYLKIKSKNFFILIDVGCGDGALLYFLKKIKGLDFYAIGVDTSLNGLILAKKMLSNEHLVDLVQADATHLPIKHGCIDVVTLLEVIEHEAKYEQLLYEIKCALKSGSMILLTTPNAKFYGPKDQYHVKEFTAEEIQALCKKYFACCWAFGSWSLSLQNLIFRIETCYNWSNSYSIRKLLDFIHKLINFINYLFFSKLCLDPDKAFTLVIVGLQGKCGISNQNHKF